MISNAEYIKVDAHVRYWDDAEINGKSTEDGSLVPFKNGDMWQPLININTGVVEGWPEGMVASFHFKVCDAGNYHLLDSEKQEIASIYNNYVPSGLCHGDTGYGDYIIFSVNSDGSINNYKKQIDEEDWLENED